MICSDMPKNYKITHFPNQLCTSVINGFNYMMGWEDKGRQLHQAIQNKNYDLITEILSTNRTNPNLKDAEGNVPLYYAFKLEDEKIITDLLNHRNINLKCPLTLELSPLQNAALWGSEKYLKLLLDTKKVAINVTDEVGDNILAYAIYSQNIESVKLLLDYPELNLRHQNIFGCNALHLASMNRQLEVVKLLLRKMDAYEALETLNNSKQHFQHILLNVFDFDDLTAEQLQGLKEIFEYRVLVCKKEINKIQNETLREMITEVDENKFQSLYGKSSIGSKYDSLFKDQALHENLLDEELPGNMNNNSND